jgi:hypothetical protein
MAKWQGKHDTESLAKHLRRRLASRAGLSERRMFGGVCFMLNGNMLCGAGKNGYMFRVDRARVAEARRLPGGRPLVMRGRAMQGFFWVEPAACDARGLPRWLALAEEYVGGLPAKPARRRRAGA